MRDIFIRFVNRPSGKEAADELARGWSLLAPPHSR
jgi:hypothetical protein